MQLILEGIADVPFVAPSPSADDAAVAVDVPTPVSAPDVSTASRDSHQAAEYGYETVYILQSNGGTAGSEPCRLRHGRHHILGFVPAHAGSVARRSATTMEVHQQGIPAQLVKLLRGRQERFLAGSVAVEKQHDAIGRWLRRRDEPRLK